MKLELTLILQKKLVQENGLMQVTTPVKRKLLLRRTFFRTLLKKNLNSLIVKLQLTIILPMKLVQENGLIQVTISVKLKLILGTNYRLLLKKKINIYIMKLKLKKK